VLLLLQCRQLMSSLQDARKWYTEMSACIRPQGKTPLEAVEPLLLRQPPPINVSGYAKLRDSVKAAQSLRARAQAVLADTTGLRDMKVGRRGGSGRGGTCKAQYAVTFFLQLSAFQLLSFKCGGWAEY
jgi:hypothetical protein